MGGADVYCAICGGPLSPPWWEDSDAQQGVEAGSDDQRSQAGSIDQCEDDASQVSDDEEQEEPVEIQEGDEEGEEDDEDEDDQDENEGNSNEGENDENVEQGVEEGTEDMGQYSYDPAIVKPEAEVMNWLHDVRIISENPDTNNLVKVYITGVATHEDLNMFNVEPGDDPSFPTSNEGFFNVYSWEADNPMAIPFHQPCYHLLRNAVGVEELDKESLYAAFKRLAHSEEYENSLDIDYGSIKDFHEQYWVTERGYEYVVFSPVDIPKLVAYYDALPELQDTPGMTDISTTHKSCNDTDPFSRLAPETKLMILDSLDVASVFRLRLASSAICNLELRQSFWRSRIEADMPWLYDFSKLKESALLESVNWTQVYKDLDLASRDKPGEERIQGLVNRRRIWQTTLPQIARCYGGLKDEKNADAEEQAIILQGATATKEPRLILPDSKDVRVVTQTFIDSLTDLPSAKTALDFRWNEHGELADIQVRQWTETGENSPGVDVVRFPDSDWMTGIIVTTKEGDRSENEDDVVRRIVGVEVLFNRCLPIQIGRQVGDKRLIHVSEDYFAVGIRTNVSSDNRISRISILQQPSNIAYNAERIAPKPVMDINLEISHLLWRNELPPPTLRTTNHSVGYWNHDIQIDVSPMEALVFGSTEEELADLTSFSADVGFGGFQVTYENGQTRSIGPRIQAMKTLKIDGRGGERIVRLCSNTAHIPVFMRFITNRGRQLVIGHDESEEDSWPPSLGAGYQNILNGFYAWWSNRPLPTATLGVLGCLYQSAPTESPAQHLFSELKDVNGLNWEPKAPPISIQEHGKIWAQREEPARPMQADIAVPDASAVASWLDCSRPLYEIESTFCHRMNTPQIPLCRITFRYSDNSEEVTAGADTFPATPSDGSGTNGQTWCWCHYSNQDEDGKHELAVMAHYTHETFRVDGKRLASLRIWLSEGGALVALQFTHEGGEAPVWTRELGDIGEPSGEIRFTGPGGGDAVGVKLFFQNSQRSVSREDSIVVAVQALRDVDVEMNEFRGE